MTESFFEKDPNDHTTYHPTSIARGPWDPNSLHGRVISGLIAYESELNHDESEEHRSFQVSRITVDLFRQPPMLPLKVQSEIVRSGRRIRVVDVKIHADIPQKGPTDIARGSVIMLRKGQNAPGKIWSPDEWEYIAPSEDIPLPGDEGTETDNSIWQTQETDGSSCKRIIGGIDGNEPRRAWIRETHNLVGNQTPTPLVRVAQVADVANPFANSGTRGLNYINADISLYLHRDPIGSWIGTEGFYHHADEGISVGTIALYDKKGRIGTSTVCGLAQIHP